jgi:hypothetical protein
MAASLAEGTTGDRRRTTDNKVSLGRRSPVAGRRSPVAGRRSPVAGRRSVIYSPP